MVRNINASYFTINYLQNHIESMTIGTPGLKNMVVAAEMS